MGSIHLQNHNSSVGANRRVPRTESQASAAEPSLHSASLARLAAYVFNHYNWKFDFLRLTVTEIVNEYLKVHVRGGNTGPDDQHQCP